jgi:hypothetical protein
MALPFALGRIPVSIVDVSGITGLECGGFQFFP